MNTKLFFTKNFRVETMNEFLKEFNKFLGKASLATYISSGPELDSELTGFKELEFREGQWYYTDSYTGFFQSWGREVVWFKNSPFWTQLYGGGMEKKFIGNKKFAHETFQFLKKAMSAGEKIDAFQPRGPKKFSDEDWEYECTWAGDISKFEGSEKIFFKNELVFTHKFFGGLVKGD